MERPTSPEAHYSAEHLEVFRQARLLQQLVGMDGWKLIDDMMGSLVLDKMNAALQVQTDSPHKAADTLRQWQITDEVVSTIRSFIHERIETATQLAPQSPLEEALLEEELNGRRNAGDDPAGGRF